jgi:peroxidase
MVSERHLRGTEFGELQLATWRRQFEALRDGDRFFYAVDRRFARSRD